MTLIEILPWARIYQFAEGGLNGPNDNAPNFVVEIGSEVVSKVRDHVDDNRAIRPGDG